MYIKGMTYVAFELAGICIGLLLNSTWRLHDILENGCPNDAITLSYPNTDGLKSLECLRDKYYVMERRSLQVLFVILIWLLLFWTYKWAVYCRDKLFKNVQVANPIR